MTTKLIARTHKGSGVSTLNAPATVRKNMATALATTSLTLTIARTVQDSIGFPSYADWPPLRTGHFRSMIVPCAYIQEGELIEV
jgi:hypothetical protein